MWTRLLLGLLCCASVSQADKECVKDPHDHSIRAYFESRGGWVSGASIESESVDLGDIDGDGVPDRAIKIMRRDGDGNFPHYFYMSNHGCTRLGYNEAVFRAAPIAPRADGKKGFVYWQRGERDEVRSGVLGYIAYIFHTSENTMQASPDDTIRCKSSDNRPECSSFKR